MPIASFVLLHADSVARPAALLGAFALLLLAGGTAGAVSSPLTNPLPRAILASLLYGAGDVTLFGARANGSLAVLTGVFLLTLLSLLVRRPPVDGRREFLQRSGAIVTGAVILLALSAVSPAMSALAGRRLFPFRRPTGLLEPGLSDLVTPAPAFYVMDKVLDYPSVRLEDWRLAVSGQVERQLSLSMSDLLAIPARHHYVTLECVDNPVGGPLMGNALWTGPLVRDILHRAGAGGSTLIFEAADNYGEGIPLAAVQTADPIIAYGMNGETLSRAHGYPARLVVPGLYGFKSVKWITGLRVVAGTSVGAWAAHGWNEMPSVHTTARIDVARREGPSVVLAGIAFAGLRGVEAVQVRVNGGPWYRAELGRALSRDSWVQWKVRLHCPGRCVAEARAVDRNGRVQAGTPHGAYPAGATGWHAVTL